jgi:hypothetical protein
MQVSQHCGWVLEEGTAIPEKPVIYRHFLLRSWPLHRPSTKLDL